MQISNRRWCHPLIILGWHFGTLKVDSTLKVPLLLHENYAYVCDTTENKCVHSPPWNKIQAPKPSKLEWKFLPTLTNNFHLFYLPESSTNSIVVIGIPTSHDINSELRVMQIIIIQMECS